MTQADLERRVGREPGKPWPAYAWPGGYPIAYVCEDGEYLCSTCMDREPVRFGPSETIEDEQWTVVDAIAFGATVDYPHGYDETCAHCGRVICEETP